VLRLQARLVVEVVRDGLPELADVIE